MHPNHQLGWAGSSAGYTPQVSSLHAHTPFWRSAFIYLIAIVAISAGTIGVVNTMAAQQVIYTPPAKKEVAVQANPTPPVPPVVAPQPAVAAATPPPDSSSGLQTILNNWAASHSSQQWSVVVKSLDTSAISASVKSSTSFRTASIYKIYLLYPLFQKYSLESLSARYLNVEGRGSVSLKDCVDLMIKVSDNPCGEAVGNFVGWGAANVAVRKLGLTSTNLNNPSGMTTTAADSALFLEKIQAGQVFNPQVQQYVLGLMRVQKNRAGIPAGCKGCIVADKNGDLPIVRHDAGIVQYGGKTYILSIFTNGASYSQIAALTGQIQTYMATH